MRVSKLVLSETSPVVRWVAAVGGDAWEGRVEWGEAGRVEVETAVVLSWPPKHAVASLPCSFSFAVRCVEATFRVEMGAEGGVSVSVAAEDFLLDLEIHSLIGHRTKLKDVPKLTEMLHTRIRQAIAARLLPPNRLTFPTRPLVEVFLGPAGGPKRPPSPVRPIEHAVAINTAPPPHRQSSKFL